MTVSTSQVRSVVENQSSTFEPVDAESDYEFDDDEPEYGRSSFLLIIGFIVVGIFFVGVIYFAYQQGYRTGERSAPEIITAPPGPEKITPSAQGDVDNSYEESMVLNGDENTEIESLLPPTEEPLDRPAAPDSATAKTAEADEQLNSTIVPGPDPDLVGGAAVAGSTLKEVPEPSAVLSEGGAQPPSASASSPTAGSSEIASAVPDEESSPVSEETEVAVADSSAPEVLSPPTAKVEPVTEAAAPEATAAEEPASAGAATGIDPLSGSHVVQILSSPSKPDAEAALTQFSGKFSDLLQDHGVAVVAAVVNGTNYYRVRIGPFSDSSSASTYCGQLKTRGQDCYVTTP